MVVVDSAGSNPFAVWRKFGTAFAPIAADWIPYPPGNGAAADGRGVTADVIDMQERYHKRILSPTIQRLRERRLVFMESQVK